MAKVASWYDGGTIVTLEGKSIFPFCSESNSHFSFELADVVIELGKCRGRGYGHDIIVGNRAEEAQRQTVYTWLPSDHGDVTGTVG